MSAEVAAWFGTWWPLWSPFALATLVFSGTGIWVILNRRGGEKAARRSTLPPTWPEMWARLDAQEKRIDTLEEELRLANDRAEDALTRAERSERRAERSDQQALEMISHIVSLEQMVPNPPGPPQRPNWKLPILGTNP